MRNQPILPGSREQRIYQYIVRFKVENDGNSPTMRQIGGSVGVKSTSMIAFYLNRLEAAGLISRPPGVCNIQLVGGRYTHPDYRGENA